MSVCRRVKEVIEVVRKPRSGEMKDEGDTDYSVDVLRGFFDPGYYLVRKPVT